MKPLDKISCFVVTIMSAFMLAFQNVPLRAAEKEEAKKDEVATIISASVLRSDYDNVLRLLPTALSDLQALTNFQARLAIKIKNTQDTLKWRKSFQDNLTSYKKRMEGLVKMDGGVDTTSPELQDFERDYYVLTNLRISDMVDSESDFLVDSPPILSRTLEDVYRYNDFSTTVSLTTTKLRTLHNKLSRLSYGRVEYSGTNLVTSSGQWGDLKADIQACLDEFAVNEKELSEAANAYKEKVIARFQNVNDLMRTEILDKQSKYDNLTKRGAQLQREIAVAEERERSKTVDQNTILAKLTWAVFAMIVSIVVLFISLKLFNENLIGMFITERTMIELLSMGFLLVTVIILGTGKLIEGQALGALLGTIAGYIFGAKQGERRGAEAERREITSRIRDEKEAAKEEGRKAAAGEKK